MSDLPPRPSVSPDDDAARGQAPHDELALFAAAYHLQDEDQRRSFLDRAGGDTRIVGRVRRLLAAGQRGDSPLDHLPFTAPPAGLRAGGVVAGRYVLVSRLGEGGMGEVWRADQREPVRRPVAVKVIKPGLNSRQVLARFAAERQALAVMDHPHIAKVFDAGATDGRPVVKVIDFGVAKAVAGPLTAATLDTGHGNLVGTPQYMSPEQATFDNRDVDTRSDVYSLGVLLYELLTGGPPFAAPDPGGPGVLETLRRIREDDPPRPSVRIAERGAGSGNPTFIPRSALRSPDFQELDWVAMKALEKDRERRYESAAAFAADVRRFLAGEPVAAHPPSAAYQLRKFVRRYRGPVVAAGLLAVALTAGVAGTAWGLVRAERAAAAERAARTRVERGNKILTDIFDGLEPPDVWEDGDSLEEVLAERLRAAAGELTDDATADPLATARLRAKLAGALNRLGHPHDALPLLEQVGPVLAARLGPDHVETLDADFALAHAYDDDDRGTEAGTLFESVHARTLAAFGPDHDRTLDAATAMASHDSRAGRAERALPVQDELVATWTRRDGPDSDAALAAVADRARTYTALGRTADAVAAFERVLRVRRAEDGPDHPGVWRLEEDLAAAYTQAGRHNKAGPLIDRVLAGRTARLGRDHLHTLGAMENAAANRAATGRFPAAVKLYEEVEKLYRAKLGPRHPHTVRAAVAAAAALARAGRADRALAKYEAVVAELRAADPADPRALDAQQAAADLCLTLGRLEPARKLFEDVVAGRAAAAGADAAATLKARRLLAVTLGRLGSHADATATHEGALKAARAKHGPDAMVTRLLLIDLGASYLNVARPADRWRAAAGPDDRETLTAARFLGTALLADGQPGKPLAVLAAARPRAVRAFGPADPLNVGLTDRLAAAYITVGRPADARQLGREWLAGRTRPAATADDLTVARMAADALRDDGSFAREEQLRRTIVAVSRATGPTAGGNDFAGLAACLLVQKKWVEAEAVARASLVAREKTDPDRWPTHAARAMVGAALLGRRDYAEAERYLLQGYRGLKGPEQELPPAGRIRLLECLDRLVECYEAEGRPDEAARWRAERRSYKGPAPPPREVR